jgi:hypothetical protein
VIVKKYGTGPDFSGLRGHFHFPSANFFLVGVSLGQGHQQADNQLASAR